MYAAHECGHPSSPSRGDDVTLIPEAPPVPPLQRKPSKWADLFAEARQNWLTWYRVDTPYTKSTAQQVASDIRRSHDRVDKRMAGILPGEVWDATWGPIDGQHYVWICFIGSD